ncbi:MAG: right-handed parallel beta-helix repeat-containing protein [Acidobacteriota bacterium]|nr:right-handed parallel beta-helix repeat-containing protein [Acidobacteriota bacterium]
MRIQKLVVSAVAAFATVLFAGTASARDLYVATSGNDASDGSLAAPFATIKKASSVALPGDVVNVRGGVYYGTGAGIMAKGTATARITFQSYPGETAIIDGTGTAAATDLFNLYKAEYVDVAGFEIRNSTRIGLNIYACKNIHARNNHIHHNVRNAVYVGASTVGISADIYIENNDVHDNALENQNLTMVDGGWAGAVTLSQTTRGAITGNRVYRNYGEGMGSGMSSNVTISGNEISDNYSGYIYIDNGQNMTVSKNLLYNTGDTRFYRLGKPAPGIGIANEFVSSPMPSSDITITNNIVINCRWGFYYGKFEAGGGLKNVTVANNTFYKATDALVNIELDNHTNSFVKNNVFYQVGNGVATVAGAGVTFASNLWYGGAPTGIAASATDSYGDPRFVNGGGFRAGDYKITTGSAASARGADLTVSTDYFGNSRTLPLDLGAHQLGATVAAADLEAPLTPGNLRTIGGSASGVTLGWDAATDNVGVTGYVIIRNGVTMGTITTTSWTDNAMAKATIYRYQIIAIDAAGNKSAATSTLELAWNSSSTESPAPSTGRRRSAGK